MAGELNYKHIVFTVIALLAWIHGIYKKHKQNPKGLKSSAYFLRLMMEKMLKLTDIH